MVPSSSLQKRRVCAVSVITPTSHCRTTLTLCDLKSSSSRFERSTTAKSLSPPPRRCCCCCCGVGRKNNNNALLLSSSSLSRKDSDAFVNQNRDFFKRLELFETASFLIPNLARFNDFLCWSSHHRVKRSACDGRRTDGRTDGVKKESTPTLENRERERERDRRYYYYYYLYAKGGLCHHDASASAVRDHDDNDDDNLDTRATKAGGKDWNRKKNGRAVSSRVLPVESISDMQEETAERRRRQGRTGRGRTAFEHDGRVRNVGRR